MQPYTKQLNEKQACKTTGQCDFGCGSRGLKIFCFPMHQEFDIKGEILCHVI